MKNAPIGIFDSGLGGLTVAREITEVLPCESLVYVGDTARCPYGPQDFVDVERYVREICTFLAAKGVKLIVIACNTGTAAGLASAQREFDIPIIGVVEPGARAAVRATRNRHVGVIGTVGTIESGGYAKAVRALDAGCHVYSVATPLFVDIVEEGLTFDLSSTVHDSKGYHDVFLRSDFYEIARDYLSPLKNNAIDTLVLGCTHYPLLKGAISQVMGNGVTLVSSAEETAREVRSTLQRRKHEADGTTPVRHQFYTTSDTATFETLGSRVFADDISPVQKIEVSQLEKLGR